MRFTGGARNKASKQSPSNQQRHWGDYFYNGKRWRKESAAYRKANPLCKLCESIGEVVPVHAVDHWAEREQFPELEYDSANYVGMCLKCHTQKTVAYKDALKSINPNRITQLLIDGHPTGLAPHIKALIVERLINPKKSSPGTGRR